MIGEDVPTALRTLPLFQRASVTAWQRELPLASLKGSCSFLAPHRLAMSVRRHRRDSRTYAISLIIPSRDGRSLLRSTHVRPGR